MPRVTKLTGRKYKNDEFEGLNYTMDKLLKQLAKLGALVARKSFHTPRNQMHSLRKKLAILAFIGWLLSADGRRMAMEATLERGGNSDFLFWPDARA